MRNGMRVDASEMGNAPLIEPADMIDIFANGIARVENLDGGCVRLVYFAEQMASSGQKERLVVARVIRPISTLMLRQDVVEKALRNAIAGLRMQ